MEAVADTITTFEVPGPRMPLTPEERIAEAERIHAEAGVDLLREAPGVFDLEIVNAVAFPDESLKGGYASGCAEPWTAQLVTAMLIASNQRDVLEIGTFTGYTTAWLALALARLGGGTLTTVDIDPERSAMAQQRLAQLTLPNVQVNFVVADSLAYLPTVPRQSVGFVWMDGNHEHHHVEREINLLWDKMKPRGIITGHDVYGSCALRKEFKKYGGYAIDLPRLGAAGGVGVLQIGAT